MPKIEVTNEQLATLRAGWELFTVNDDYDDLADSLDISAHDRGLEDEDGNESEDYSEDEDVLLKRVGEITLILNGTKFEK
jgi:hypothetical protein